jgi:hypothetical protein
MKCAVHQLEAVAVCCYCGRAICSKCGNNAKADSPGEQNVSATPKADGPTRRVCSDACASALARVDENLNRLSGVSEKLLLHSIRNTRASAFYCYLGGTLSASAAIVAWFILPSTFLILFTGACGVVLIVSGFWYSRAARKGVS